MEGETKLFVYYTKIVRRKSIFREYNAYYSKENASIILRIRKINVQYKKDRFQLCKNLVNASSHHIIHLQSFITLIPSHPFIREYKITNLIVL